MAKRRAAHPKRLDRLAHITATELAELARLGAQITRVRKAGGRRTITAIAEIAGINPSSLGELERGRTNVTYVVLLRLAQALEVPVTDLIPTQMVANSDSERPNGEPEPA